MKITILGCGSAKISPNRYPTSMCLVNGTDYILFDCGEGIQQQLMKFKISIEKIKVICISHLHGDHYFGLFGLLSTMQLMKRKNKVIIFAPKELEEVLMAFYKFPNMVFDFEIEVKSIDPKTKGFIYESKEGKLSVINLYHPVECYGFRYEQKRCFNIKKEDIERLKLNYGEINQLKNGKDLEGDKCVRCEDVVYEKKKPLKFAYCTDTMPNREIVKEIKGVDWLFYEATFGNEMLEFAKQTGHSTAGQAGEMAKRGEVKRLYIGHFSSRYMDTKNLLMQAKEEFEECYVAREGLIIE